MESKNEVIEVIEVNEAKAEAKPTKVVKSTPAAAESRRRCRNLNKSYGECATSYALHLIKLKPELVTDKNEDPFTTYDRILKNTTLEEREKFKTFYRTKKAVKQAGRT